MTLEWNQLADLATNSMTTKHERDVLAKVIKGEITKRDCEEAIDMGRTGTANRMWNVAMEVLKELKWEV